MALTVEVHGLTGKHFPHAPQIYLLPKDPEYEPAYRNEQLEMEFLASPDGKLRRYKIFVLPGPYELILQTKPNFLVPIDVSAEGPEQTLAITYRK